jgi:hypothetical protein
MHRPRRVVLPALARARDGGGARAVPADVDARGGRQLGDVPSAAHPAATAAALKSRNDGECGGQRHHGPHSVCFPRRVLATTHAAQDQQMWTPGVPPSSWTALNGRSVSQQPQSTISSVVERRRSFTEYSDQLQGSRRAGETVLRPIHPGRTARPRSPGPRMDPARSPARLGSPGTRPTPVVPGGTTGGVRRAADG